MPVYQEGNDTRITSTSEAVKGDILFGNSAYNEAEDVLNIAGTIQTEALVLPTGAAPGLVMTCDAEGNAGWEASTGGVTGHGQLNGLTDDDHLQYAALEGRAGGQVLTGGTEDGDDLELRSTSNQVGFGRVRIGAHGIVVDESMDSAIGIGCDPQSGAHVQLTGDGDFGVSMQRNSAPASSGGDLVLSTGASTGTGTAKVQVKAAPPGATGTDDNAPVVALEVRGDGNVLAGPQAGVAQNAASGFLCIPIIATGDPTGTPVGIPAGMAAIGYVAATSKLAIWNGSAWKLIAVDA